MVNGEARKERRRALLEEANRDPLYLAELETLEQEFASADAEAWRMIDVMDERGIQ